MNQWPFILAAYGLTAVGAVALAAWSYLAMRDAEK